jgi:hypothetical protein
MASADKRTPAMTLLIRPLGNGRFEIREGEHLLGTSQNEMMAVWSAVAVAEEIAKAGSLVRVVVLREGKETEEFVTTPRKAG